jgi:hypothetical protein
LEVYRVSGCVDDLTLTMLIKHVFQARGYGLFRVFIPNAFPNP